MADTKGFSNTEPGPDSPKLQSSQEMRELLWPFLADQLNVDEGEIDDSKTFIDDLGGDSLGMVEIAMGIEERLCLKIPDEALEEMKTVGDAIKYLCGVYGISYEGDGE